MGYFSYNHEEDWPRAFEQLKAYVQEASHPADHCEFGQPG